MRERRTYVNRTQFPTRGDKAVRARSIQGRMALDGLFYPKNAPWVADFLAEILKFSGVQSMTIRWTRSAWSVSCSTRW